ncbi:MAG: hypothetical protein LC119_07605 [Burkholderiales bacterium]|nr:hypothetical protein [Burkholderiales bacterium]
MSCCSAGAAAADLRDCGPAAPVLHALAPRVWQVPAADSDASAANRGRVSNLLLVHAQDRVWLLGSGPTAAAGRALACVLRRDLGLRATDVVSPWARPELVLGFSGLRAAGGPALRHWAHEDVAKAMAERCPSCVQRLAQRLDSARDDLGADPVSLPTELFGGSSGELGPFRWWRFSRAEAQTVTVWRLQTAQGAIWYAPGLINGSGPGDARDADIAVLQRETLRLADLARADGATVRYLGEQGPVADAGAAAQQARYWQALLEAVRAAMEAGQPETAPPRSWPGLPPAWARHPWHALNWQHAWREAEVQWLEAPR